MTRKPLTEDQRDRLLVFVASNLKKLQIDTDDMAPRVKMLNHWHDEVDAWRKKVDTTLGLMKWPSILGGIASVVKLALDLGHALGWF